MSYRVCPDCNNLEEHCSCFGQQKSKSELAAPTGSAVFDAAQDLESHARNLIKHRHTAPEWMWENLANSVNRLNTARQSYDNSKPLNDKGRP